MLALLLLTAVCACVAIVVAVRAVHTCRALRRALEDKALKTGEAVPMTDPRWFPRFGLKSLLVTTTLLAVAVGLVGKELVRARQQDKILTDFEIGNLGGGEFYVEAEYSMGILGTGTLARLLTENCHPSFGCEVSSLSLVSDNYDGRLYCEPLYPSTAHIERLGQLRQLEALKSLAYGFRTNW